jgi:polyferredoxin
VILLTTFFAGRLWCSHLCPIGGTTELVSRVIPDRVKLKFSFLHAPAFRYAYVSVYVAAAFLGIGSISCKLCNFRVIPFLAGSPFIPGYRTYLLSSVGAAGLFTVALTGFLAKYGRAYCNLLCPVGALDSMMNYAGHKVGFVRRVRTDRAKCNGWALELDGDNKIKRSQASCMSCRDCVTVCPQEAIRYGKA